MVTQQQPIKKATRSRGRPRIEKARSLDGNIVKKCYCRRCMEMKPPKLFYEATDTYLDRNGKLSVCIDCVDDIFGKTYAQEGDFGKTIYTLCKILNVKYDEKAVENTISNIRTLEQKGKPIGNIFGYYKTKLMGYGILIGEGNLTFTEPTKITMDTNVSVDTPDAKYLDRFWGKGLSIEDYEYLEEQLSEWKQTHKSDTKAEITLLKEICFRQLEIRKSREQNNSVDNDVKVLQDLMKTASVDPAKSTLAGSGKSNETFSAFIHTIEQNRPAEYYKNKELFKDFDNVDWYFKKYVTRPLENFVKGTRDFDVSEDDSPDLDDSSEIIPANYIEEEDNG